ncbi:MAG: peptidyl-prolyl cis-trans isomerase [Candidatus Saccharicenans sp.]|nr:peptidyl-prolyl cis-trans isomerase [Candidatus Saccharicenans sp.]HOL45763.1 peptidyl-prolyl cis-trans isomerase [Candidatus Saccharicenans sp.]HPP24136.1 peptidyl-prolyl cis-trans isomerase [Candidatus Saccharicenans sp.]
MKKTRLLIIIPAIIVMAGGGFFGYRYIEQRQKEKAEAKKGQLPVLKIEEITYSLSDFENYVRQIIPRGQDLDNETLSQLVDQFVEDKLILYSAKMRKMELSDSEKQAFWQRLIRDYPPQEGLKEQLASDQGLEDSLLVAKYKYEKIKEVVVTEDEIKAYYQEHKKDFLVPERVMVSHILVSSSDLAVELQQKLSKADETAFRQAARNYSEAPDAYKGGLMGVFKPGDLPYDMEKVVFGLEEGKISQVFQSPYGYHIFRLDKRYAPALLEEEEVSRKIRNILMENKVKDIIEKEVEELKATYHWQVFTENLPFKNEGKENA